MGKRSRSAGLRYEREALEWWRDQQLDARRTAASGAQEGYVGDIEVPLSSGLNVEVKYSSVDRGMRVLRGYLKPVDVVMARAPGEAWMFVLPPKTMAYLVNCAARVEREDALRVEDEFESRERPTLTEMVTP
jgi:Holliday junction resolvase